MSKYETLTVTNKKRLTPNAVALTLGLTDSNRNLFTYKAGQYITIEASPAGAAVRRSYSICSAPYENELTIGVKEVEGGVFSSFANQKLQKGDFLQVHPPEGRFTLDRPDAGQNILAFAAGSGITPILSILKTALKGHNDTSFVLVYGNKTPADEMFQEEISALQDEFSNRLYLYRVYSQSNEKDALFGRINQSIINFVVLNKHKHTVFNSAYVCGPEGMIDAVTQALPKDRFKENIFVERFTSSEPVETVLESETSAGDNVRVDIVLDEENYSLDMPKNERVLLAALDEGIDAPYSCQGGICSSCLARLKKGKVSMVNNQILTDGEIAEGLILTCQAQPLTPHLLVDYDDI